MKYKIGDKIKVRSWGEMSEEYGFFQKDKGLIAGPCQSQWIFTKNSDNSLDTIKDRILTIKDINIDCYSVKEITNIALTDWMIEGLAKDIFKPIDNRFEILDLRNE